VIALAGVTLALAVGLAVAIWQAVLLADRVEELESDQDRGDYAVAARTLLELAFDLRKFAAEQLEEKGPADAYGTTLWNVAAWLDDVRVPAIARECAAAEVNR
jgi:hypothetical protein